MLFRCCKMNQSGIEVENSMVYPYNIILHKKVDNIRMESWCTTDTCKLYIHDHAEIVVGYAI